MLSAADLRARAAEYRAAAKRAGDDRTREQYVRVAEYLDEWAAQVEASKVASPAAPRAQSG